MARNIHLQDYIHNRKDWDAWVIHENKKRKLHVLNKTEKKDIARSPKTSKRSATPKGDSDVAEVSNELMVKMEHETSEMESPKLKKRKSIGESRDSNTNELATSSKKKKKKSIENNQDSHTSELATSPKKKKRSIGDTQDDSTSGVATPQQKKKKKSIATKGEDIGDVAKLKKSGEISGVKASESVTPKGKKSLKSSDKQGTMSVNRKKVLNKNKGKENGVAKSRKSL